MNSRFRSCLLFVIRCAGNALIRRAGGVILPDGRAAYTRHEEGHTITRVLVFSEALRRALVAQDPNL